MSDQPTSSQPILPSRVRDLNGKPFGRLTVIAFAGHVQLATQRQAAWLCRCSCGVEKVILAQSLQNGRSNSCGCLQRKGIGDRRRTHGRFRTPEYTVWQNMKKRCLDQGYRRYPGYGGRGITICDRWRDSFEAFLADMGTRPSPKHSIERRDNDGPYEPSNCIWAVRRTQDRNKRTNHLITFRGETMILADWAARTGILYETIRHRLAVGWSVEKALTTPGRKPIEYN
jgi:hypothetical protein